jgi:hypothetical protein
VGNNKKKQSQKYEDFSVRIMAGSAVPWELENRLKSSAVSWELSWQIFISINKQMCTVVIS